jgi:fructan beta-fructosidase
MLPKENAGKAFQLTWTADAGENFSCTFQNNQQEEIIVGYEAATKTFYINRNAAGSNGEAKNFNRPIRAPRLSNNANIPLRVVMDASSLEIFADEGLTVMTTVFFPSERMDRFRISGKPGKSFRGLSLGSFEPKL